jgi:hypothetical protein
LLFNAGAHKLAPCRLKTQDLWICPFACHRGLEQSWRCSRAPVPGHQQWRARISLRGEAVSPDF